MNRRSFLKAALVSGAAFTACRRGETAMKQRMPTLFLAHGAPILLDDRSWVAELAAWAAALPKPKSILMVSAHWEDQPVTLAATETVPLVYDFYNFPEKYYRQQYPAPGAPELARRVHAILRAHQPVKDEPTRGLDHGAYVPLVAMYPQADVPVLQMSLPTLEAKSLFQLGARLAPLRDEGILIVGSGSITHNLRYIDFAQNAPVPAWASDFDAWCQEVLTKRDVDALLDYRTRAPGVQVALPTHEHFAPLAVALGAGNTDSVKFPIEGFWGGSFTRRSVQFG